MDITTLLFSANGRINRAKYWTGALIVAGVYIAVWITFMILGAILGGNQSTEPGTFSVSGPTAIPYLILGFAALVFYVWATVCLGIKRCHDRDRSGWFMIIPIFNIWVAIEMAFLPGTPGPNRYGPDPLAATRTPVGYTPA